MSIYQINDAIEYHLCGLVIDASEGDMHFRCSLLNMLYKELEIAELVQK
jgi:hypothetical protein